MVRAPTETRALARSSWAYGSAPPDAATLAALAYLALPNLLFVVGWFRWPAAMTLLFLLYVAARRLPLASAMRHGGAPASRVLFVVVAGMAWAAFSGGAHLMHADHDWVVRDSVLGELLRNEWPVTYADVGGTGEKPVLLRSAVGYFLPPALLGKLAGPEAVPVGVLLWTGLGSALFLALLPLPRRSATALAAAIALVVMFSGMDLLGAILATGSLPIFPLRLEWWGPLSYPSLTGQLLWAPNHALPAWIGMALLLRHRDDRHIITMALVVLSLTAIWSPFAPLALLPFALLVAVPHLRRKGVAALDVPAIAATSLYCIPLALFLTLDLASMSAPTLSTGARGFSVAQQPVAAADYLLFVCCEFGLLAVALWRLHGERPRDMLLLGIAILLLLPWFRFGPSNDLLIRLSAPPLVVLLSCSLSALVCRPPQATLATWLAWLVLGIGAATAVVELWRAASFPRRAPDYQTPLAARQGGRISAHYAGRLDSAALHVLLRTPQRGADR